ncbi:hypothetical protein PIB30_023470 [Stylosanthes scabra]|uniref:Uncharacterized protein n=1 Tax=Stylosanthes scabra TaxID=79078 RepID=A0ABU6R9S9_9FABA|nr:hypothetical protein [Stylosanthes scabra]
MFDGLLGRGFSAKCKSLIKQTKNRIDVIRRKRKATEKFLKRDIADLLANLLEDNAYNRAEGLIAELTMSSCYDFIEQSCDFVLKHLSVLQKLSFVMCTTLDYDMGDGELSKQAPTKYSNAPNNIS